MTETPVTFKSAGQQIVGLLHRPRGRGPFPTAVFLHGFTGSSAETHRLFVECARLLAGSGIAALRFDFRGAGNSAGSFRDYCISSQVADARAALRWLRRQPGVDVKRIGLVGMSMGGMVAALVMADDHRIRAGVLWNPVSDPTVRRDLWITPEHLRQLKQGGAADWSGWPVGRALFKELGTSNPVKALTKATCPVRIVQAADDQTTPPAGAETYRLAMLKAGRAIDLKSVAGADHGFSRFAWTAQALELTRDWLARQLA